MQDKRIMASVFKKSLLVAGVASLLLTTGCAATSVKAAEVSTAPASASGTTAPTKTAEASATPKVAATFAGNFDSLIDTSAMGVKAGESLRVTGGTIKPGAKATVYIAQLMAMPSYDAANDMYRQVGEQVKIGKPVVVTVNAKGQYDVQVPVPAGTAPQEVDVILELTGVDPGAPSGGLFRSRIG
jgi:hypothetical protein